MRGRSAISRVECPRCRNLIDPRATRCQHCHVDFNDADLAAIRESASARQRTTAGIIAGIVVIFLLLVAIGQCGPRPASDGKSADLGQLPANDLAPLSSANESAPAADPARAAAPPSEPRSQWIYSRTRDELRNGDVVTARLRSSNSTDLDFPYGNVHLNITVRRHPEWGLDVIFTVDEGQILCRIRDCSGTINFDGEPERLSLNESADNDSAVVFAQYPDAVLRKLRTSDRVIVELPFYRNGNRQFTFATGGLEWPPPE